MRKPFYCKTFAEAKKDMNKRVLLIDDERSFGGEGNGVTMIARTYNEGISALMDAQGWDELLLDHDLGMGSYVLTSDEEFERTGRNFIEYTGYDIMCFLEEHPEYLPKKINIVSSNPVGRIRMQQVINRLYKEDINDMQCL